MLYEVITIHDLRLEVNGRVAQIDHLLVNRTMTFYVFETKHFHAGIKIGEDGQFLKWNNYRKTFEGMPSTPKNPLATALPVSPDVATNTFTFFSPCFLMK